MPQNRGEDRGDVNRAPPVTGSARRDELVAFLNRIVMVEQEAVAILQDVAAAESSGTRRERLAAIADENRRAVEVAERAIRDLGGRASPVRKTAGLLAARSRFLVAALPARAREALRTRDVRSVTTRPPAQAFVDCVDAHLAELAAHAHSRLLRGVAEALGEPALLDAVREDETAAEAHSEWLARRRPRWRASGSSREASVERAGPVSANR